MGRKHCGKRRNCLLGAISPFPKVFSKDFHCKPGLVWERVKKSSESLGRTNLSHADSLKIAQSFGACQPTLAVKAHKN